MWLQHLASVLLFLIALTTATVPVIVKWNTTKSYGPDGPWQVVTVELGQNAAGDAVDTMDLLPGGIWESMVNTPLICNGSSTSACPAAKAGLYNTNNSHNAIRNFTNEVGLVYQWSSEAALNITGEATNVLDVMSMNTLGGLVTVGNSTLSAVDTSQIMLPDGTNYSTQVGSLSLGAPNSGLQPFGTDISNPAFGDINGQTFPGALAARNDTPSNSFGLHYGSASLNQVGSLVWGGYDQSRVLGDIGSFDLSSNNAMQVSLFDIQIGVENGTSPFTSDSLTGLLKLNASFNGVQPVTINPVVPYFFMSSDTCAAIARNLPVTLQPNIGLYTWNTADPQFQNILKSPSYLAFIFQNSGAGNLTIKVPFQLLNLTLEAPIVSQTQQYFPCRPFQASDGTGAYFFGRAFLQAAFLGMNWEQRKWFLAQAPGPGVGASNVIPIGPKDTTIGSAPISNFASTWAREWTPLSNPNNTTPNASNPKGNSNSGLSSGAKAGIGVGAAVGGLAIAAAVMLFFLRKRRDPVPPQEKTQSKLQYAAVHEKSGEPSYVEAGECMPHEAETDGAVHELAGRENP